MDLRTLCFLCCVTLVHLSESAMTSQTYHRALKTRTIPISQSAVISALKSQSIITCANVCLEMIECTTFQFDEYQHICYPMTCVNINAVIDTAGDSNVYINSQVSHLLARDKPTQLTDVHTDDTIISYGGEKAVDGIYLPSSINESWDSPYLTLGNSRINPWWRVDLEQVHCVWAIMILNRAERDTTWQHTKNARITVSVNEEDINDDTNNLCSYYPGVLNQYYTTITCTAPMAGRFVQIKLMAQTSLQFYEVEVHGF